MRGLHFTVRLVISCLLYLPSKECFSFRSSLWYGSYSPLVHGPRDGCATDGCATTDDIDFVGSLLDVLDLLGRNVH